MPTLLKQELLFCKPKADPSLSPRTTNELLYSEVIARLNAAISFRSLNLKKDLLMIHEWVKQDYALEYWQLNGHFSQLFAIYQCMELNPFSHSFIGNLTPVSPLGEEPRGDATMICQFDVYSVFADELREHIQVEPHDCGFHLLMAPNKKSLPGLTVAVVNAFLNYYFSFPEAQRMYAEPDVNNAKSIALLERVGFKRIKEVEMSYKRAIIYCKERDS